MVEMTNLEFVTKYFKDKDFLCIQKYGNCVVIITDEEKIVKIERKEENG